MKNTFYFYAKYMHSFKEQNQWTSSLLYKSHKQNLIIKHKAIFLDFVF